VLIGLSGGSDSVALTLLLRDLAQTGGFAIAGLAHLNHRLRESACRDEQFCRDFAGRHALPFLTESIDVRGYSAAQRLSLEDAARRVRYDFLERAAAKLGGGRIAVGHTQDDQAETFLLKLMRGAGLTGLGGIYPRRDSIIRPLLDTARDDLRRFLDERGEPWMEDETNADQENPRNRLRHRIIPELDRTSGGRTIPALARAAALIREDAAWLDQQADAKFSELAIIRGGRLTDIAQYSGSDPPRRTVEFEVAGLVALPLPLRHRVLLRALRMCAEAREVGLPHVEAVQDVLEGTRGGADIPGGRVELRRGMLVLLQQGTF
jgi:tRNA(Ile)-lysidine synthase